ncbi:ANKRD50 [Symbiodinium necroappetens]|uniref:ANKRD50 protein n=1 Tax=Symbiodinium necroappetens TaxID=1628268 RepID=A0A812Q032_9DINO|nr:ANKRD50 [Symbiodinium necroappetens]
MQDMDDDAKSVAKTERSLGGETSSSAAKPGSGLCKDGTVFLKVKTCIACGIKNTDTNEIQKGSLAENRYTVWHRGTSIDPSSKDCRVCHMTYQIGSFGEEGESIEAFCTKMRKSPQLQAEFDAARTKMLELLNEGQVRFKAKTLHNAKAKLEDCRKKVVEEFKEASEQIVTPYKMYERSLYEQMHPGAIERKGLKVAKKVINGELKEVVMIRKQREGEWDLNVVEKVGVKHKEEVATSDLKLHEGQLGNKFASSKKRVFSAVDKANDWQDAHAEDDKGGAGAEELPSRVEEESSEDDDFMTGSLLQDIGSPPKKSQRNKMLSHKELNTMVTDVETSDTYKKSMQEFQSRAQEYMRKATQLDNKVKKWQNLPAEIGELSGRQKELAGIYQSCAGAFQLSAKRSPCAEKMEQAIQSLQGQNLQVPLAWCDFYLMEKLTDCIRFKRLEDFVEACDPANKVFSDAEPEQAAASVLRCLGETFCNLVPAAPDPAASQKRGRKRLGAPDAELLATLVEQLLAGGTAGDQILEEVSIFAEALGKDDGVREKACQQLNVWKADGNYFGVLRPMLRNEKWPAFAESLTARPSAASVSTELRALFEKVNAITSSLPEQIKDDFADMLLKAAETAEDCDGVNSVMIGLKLFAEEARKQQLEVTMRLCKDIASRGVSAMDFQGDQVLKDEIFSKGCWQFPGLEAVLADSPAEDKHKQVLLQTFSELKAAVAKLKHTDSLLGGVLALAKASQEHADQICSEDLQSSVVRCWSAIKHKTQTDPDVASDDDPLRIALDKLLMATKIEQVGPQVYDECMQQFRLSAKNVMEAAMQRQQKATADALRTVLDMEHKCMQCSALSDTPVFARSCISFACVVFAKVCEVLPSAVSEKVPDELLTCGIVDTVAAACDREACKQKLLQILDQDTSEKFFEQASALHELLKPLFTKKSQALEKLLAEALQAMKDAVVLQSTADMPLEAFVKAVLSGDRVKALLKQLRIAEKNMQACGLLKQGSLQEEVTELKNQARLQILKWGAAVILTNPELDKDSAKGKGLRKALKDIWDSHGEEKEFQKVLGEDACNLVATSLKGPAKREGGEDNEDCSLKADEQIAVRLTARNSFGLAILATGGGGGVLSGPGWVRLTAMEEHHLPQQADVSWACKCLLA